MWWVGEGLMPSSFWLFIDRFLRFVYFSHKSNKKNYFQGRLNGISHAHVRNSSKKPFGIIYLKTVSWCLIGSIKINDVLGTKSGNKLTYDNGIENINSR